MIKKSTSIIAAILACALLFSGCAKPAGGDKVADGTVKVTDLAQTMAENISFDAELSLLSERTALDLYHADPQTIKEMAIYTGNDEAADEFAVFEAKDETGASAIKDCVVGRVDFLRKKFAGSEAELAKLKAPPFFSYGNYVIVCIAADPEAAKTVINGYLGK